MAVFGSVRSKSRSNGCSNSYKKAYFFIAALSLVFLTGTGVGLCEFLEKFRLLENFSKNT